MKTQKLAFAFTVLLLIAALFSACDPHKPPRIKFKTDAGYTSADATVAKGALIKIGVIGDKVEDDMKTFNVSYAYDGSTSTTTKETFTLTKDEENHYEKDYEFNVRNEAGVENWYFVITDRDGNIAKLSLTLTVE
jgi:hypothetical protein